MGWLPSVMGTAHKVLFAWHFRNRRFAEAVAALPDRPSAPSSKYLWACYRLGMHATVAASIPADPGWCGAYARAVSLAACGRRVEAERAARQVLNREECKGRLASLAGALAPFMPELALELIAEAQAPPSLRAALLLRTGQEAKARDLLQRSFAAGAEQDHPELYLHQSNAEAGSPHVQLERLNAFFAAHGLPPVKLRDTNRPPSPRNVCAREPVAPVDGPLVTVLMTSFETGDRVGAAIDSVLQQSYRNLELIVVDDASTDDTRQVVGARLARDRRVKYVRLDENGGTYLAKNAGFILARGEFVTCHDSDDWSHPLKLERQVLPLLQDRSLVCTTSHWVRMQDDGTYYARPVHPLMRMNPSSPLFRRDRVRAKIGGWDCVRTGADMEFLGRLKVVFGSEAVRSLREPLAIGSHRCDSLMTAGATGYTATGTSFERMAYWEAWSWRHIGALAGGRKPRLPPTLE